MEKMSILIENLEFLASHNKNYTKKQYYTILECLEIAKGLEQKANLCKEGIVHFLQNMSSNGG